MRRENDLMEEMDMEILCEKLLISNRKRYKNVNGNKRQN